jgi:hypothetical protein
MDNMPLPCEKTAVTLAQCAASRDVTGITAGQKVCDINMMRLKAGAISGFDKVVAKVDSMLESYNESFGFNCTTKGDTDCEAGRAMFELLNCGYFVAVATETYDALCNQIAGGLMNLANGFAIFFLGYNLAFFVFLLGYKRWNRKYQEGYGIDVDGDGEADGNWKSDGETAGVEGNHAGFIGAMCSSLKLGCSGGHKVVVGDSVVFGDGKHHVRIVTAEQTEKKSGYALTKHNEDACPVGGGEAGIELAVIDPEHPVVKETKVEEGVSI